MISWYGCLWVSPLTKQPDYNDPYNNDSDDDDDGDDDDDDDDDDDVYIDTLMYNCVYYIPMLNLSLCS